MCRDRPDRLHAAGLLQNRVADDGTVLIGGYSDGLSSVDSWSDFARIVFGFSLIGIRNDGSVMTADGSLSAFPEDWKPMTRIRNPYGVTEDGRWQGYGETPAFVQGMQEEKRLIDYVFCQAFGAALWEDETVTTVTNLQTCAIACGVRLTPVSNCAKLMD